MNGRLPGTHLTTVDLSMVIVVMTVIMRMVVTVIMRMIVAVVV